MQKLLGTCFLLFFSVSSVPAANIYQITSTDGRKTIKYEVHFGGSLDHNIWTAFCPKSQKFVYLSWLRGKQKPPQVAATIWDHQTGRTIKLYRFPNCRDPLPVIDSIADLKVCPFTGDKKFKLVRTRIAD
jgi:hypothetical protein